MGGGMAIEHALQLGSHPDDNSHLDEGVSDMHKVCAEFVQQS